MGLRERGAAGLLVPQFVRWLRHQTVDRHVTLNLLVSELVVGSGVARVP